MQDEQFTNNTAQSRYEMSVGGKLAGFAEYTGDGTTLRFTHTQVEPQNEGKGVGSRLARYALDDVRKQGLRAIASCEFIAGYIDKHPEYADLVPPG